MKIVIIIAQNGFQDLEYDNSRKAIEEEGIEVKTASPTTKITNGHFGAAVQPDLAIKDIDMNNFDGIAIIGGSGALTLANFPELFKVLKEAEELKKVISAICIAPTLLAKAGLLKYKKATVWNEDSMQSPLIEREGAQYTGEMVTQDGRIVTANGPPAATEFGKKVAEVMKAQ